MKIKVLKRSVDDFVRETKHDIHKVHRNYRFVLEAFAFVIFPCIDSISMITCRFLAPVSL